MTTNDWLTIIAIILGPILAVQIQNLIQRIKETKDRKEQIFKTLMATRAAPLYVSHVEALNLIDIEFYKNKEIVNAWKLLLDNLSNYPQNPDNEDYSARLSQCSERSNELLTDLLFEMAKVLGYKFDKVLIKRGCYIPKGHGEYQFEQDSIRKGLLQVLWNNKPIQISVADPKIPEPEKKIESLTSGNTTENV